MRRQPLGTLVVPIDYTEPSLKALTVAVRLGQEQQAGVHLVYVTDSGSAELADAREPAQADGNARIQTLARQMAQQHQIRGSATYRVGGLTEVVAAVAHEVGASLIVMGTQPGNDRIALRRATEAYQLVETAPCPVLTIPAGREWPGFGRILFPVRPVPGALAKYEAVRSLLTERNRAELVLLALFSPDEVISRYELEEAVSLLNGKLSQDGVRSRTEFCPTDLVAETVLEKARQYNADLLVVTAESGKRSDAFFTGSFARQILRQAPCPVLTIRPEPALPAPGNPII